MDEKNKPTGFEQPRKVQDEYVGKVLTKYSLPLDASLEQIEPIATRLLDNPLTFFDGAEMVLGRRVGAEEINLRNKNSMLPLITLMPTGREKFGALLMQIDTNQIREEK